MSTALFAPAWTYEDVPWEAYVDRQHALWAQFDTRMAPRRLCGLPLTTSFCVGFGRQLRVEGRCVAQKPWANLSTQSLLPNLPLSATNPYFLQVGASTYYFPELSADVSDQAAFNGSSCFRVACGRPRQAPPEGAKPRCVCRLYSVATSLASPLCVSVVVGYRRGMARPLATTLVLVLNDVPDGARYLELPLLARDALPSGAVILPPEPQMEDKLKERYGVARSRLHAAPDSPDRLTVAEAEKSPLADNIRARWTEFQPLVEEEGPGANAVQWQRRWFVLMDPLLRHRQLHELRLAVEHAEDTGTNHDVAEALLGEIKLFHPSALAADL